jgi:hypothetical protein
VRVATEPGGDPDGLTLQAHAAHRAPACDTFLRLSVADYLQSCHVQHQRQREAGQA